MKRPLILVLAILTFSFTALAEPPSAVFKKAVEPVADHYIVSLKESVTPKAEVPAVASEMVTRAQGHLLATFTNGVRGFGVRAPEGRIRALLHDPRVEKIEEAARVHLSAQRTFPVGEFWHLDRIDQNYPWLDGSYNWIFDGTGVDVYIIDTGVMSSHSEFLPGQVDPGRTYAGLDSENPDIQYPADNPCGDFVNNYQSGHGTAVASLVGGQTTSISFLLTMSLSLHPRIIRTATTAPISRLREWDTAACSTRDRRRSG